MLKRQNIRNTINILFRKRNDHFLFLNKKHIIEPKSITPFYCLFNSGQIASALFSAASIISRSPGPLSLIPHK